MLVATHLHSARAPPSAGRCGSCGEIYDSHTTTFETSAERAACGKATEANLGGWSEEKPHLDAVRAPPFTPPVVASFHTVLPATPAPRRLPARRDRALPRWSHYLCLARWFHYLCLAPVVPMGSPYP